MREVVQNILLDQGFVRLTNRFTNHNLELSPFLTEKVEDICNSHPKQSGEEFFIKGGDVMVIAPNNFAIALSERTNRQAVRRVAKELIKKGAERVFQAMIRAKRNFIHLDTVCSAVGQKHIVVHPEAVSAYGDTLCWNDKT